MSVGTLHIVAVPIGNPEDVTLRALRVLGEVAVVACEDTRTTAALLAKHGVRAKLVSYHDHNEVERAGELVERLRAGEDVALVSDAGTPLVNDPGFRLVQAAIAAGIAIDVVPGPSAAIAALVGSGLAVDRFLYGGFLPREAGPRRAALVELGGVAATLVLYESPQRLGETLEEIASLWPERPVCVARNLTKQHEQWLRGTAAEVRAVLGDETRGEVVLLVGRGEVARASDAEIDARIDGLADVPTKEAADRVAAAFGLPRKEAYARVLTRRKR
ncbi:MAG: 16S rRNA (cytidine(1402)-2'-O)-methyltransferase [Myxococcota bacterium]